MVAEAHNFLTTRSLSRRTIAQIYLLEALVELLLVGEWAVGVVAARLTR